MRILVYMMFFGVLIFATFLIDLITGGSNIFVQKKQIKVREDDALSGGSNAGLIKVSTQSSASSGYGKSNYGNNYGKDSYGGSNYGKNNYGNNSYGQDSYGSNYATNSSASASSSNIGNEDDSVDLQSEFFGKNNSRINQKTGLDNTELDDMETVYEGKSYEVYLLDDDKLKLAHKVWFDFVKPPSKVLRGNYYRDTWAKDGCCLWLRRNHYEIVYKSKLFKKLGYQKFKNNYSMHL